MENGNFSQPSVLTLRFGDLKALRYLYCVIAVSVYLSILIFNGIVITTIKQNRSLHEPMYIFISVLCFNGLYGSSSFFLGLFVNLLQETQTISYSSCLAQVFCIHTYGSFEMTILAVMAYDSYVCICNPLRYPSIMTSSTVFKLILGAYLQPVIIFGCQFIFTVRLPLCSSEILKIYCDNWSVVRLSCVDTTLNNYFGIFVTTAMLGVNPLFIFFTYVQIFRVCGKSSKAVRDKSLQTCTLHLISIVTFILDTLFELLLYRYAPEKLPYEFRVIMSLQFLVVPPLLNPFLYGVKMKNIRTKVIGLFQKKRL
ncbi:PREDICTED: olfactory receptor 51I2-like [Nanorana parkeri]|uniref:olfactory receptor 51I2-like n=1 Tax=Nanorana parkeri TaxID=125878 RepID=UPI000854E3B0|nr:PREDICTED: olfactory receptor 51I2-like [Nanorana parkeri]